MRCFSCHCHTHVQCDAHGLLISDIQYESGIVKEEQLTKRRFCANPRGNVEIQHGIVGTWHKQLGHTRIFCDSLYMMTYEYVIPIIRHLPACSVLRCTERELFASLARPYVTYAVVLLISKPPLDSPWFWFRFGSVFRAN
jgi:hypothetical protein